MKILLTGGGTGGHFYPIIAVAEQLNKITSEEKIIDAKLFYMAPTPFDSRMLFENQIQYISTPAGKVRNYFSILNFTDTIKTTFGIIKSVFKVFSIYPDVVFSKGGYGAFPALVACRLFRIPLVIHESDSVPGKVGLWSGKFAKKIAISYPEASKYFIAEKTALTGNPIRSQIMEPVRDGAYEFLKLTSNIPTILIIGGSQGSQNINEIMLSALPTLLSKYQIIHQTGENNFSEVSKTAEIVIGDSPYKNRYKVFPYLNDLALKMSAGIASLVVSRAGSSIFEIANWGIPSILIPLTDSASDHQRLNAISYAQNGACTIIEEANFTPNVISNEIDRIMNDINLRQKMSESAKAFAPKDSANKIAREIINIALEHEK